jgi:hypothetical protein
MHHPEGVTGCECKLERDVLMRSLVSEETLVLIRSFRLDKCEALEASLVSNRLSILA